MHHCIQIPEETYEDILQYILNLSGQYNIWADTSQLIELTVPPEQFRDVINVKQACVLNGPRHIQSINQSQLLLKNNSNSIKEYLTYMVTWADNLSQAYSLIDFLKCANNDVNTSAL